MLRCKLDWAEPRHGIETMPITIQLCLSDMNVSQCQHISEPKHIRRTWWIPSFCPWLNERKRQIVAREVYNEETILGGKKKTLQGRIAAQLRSQEGKERGRHWGPNATKDGINFGSDDGEESDRGGRGDLGWTLSPWWITNHSGKAHCWISWGLHSSCRLFSAFLTPDMSHWELPLAL